MDSSGFMRLAKNFTNLTEEECTQLRELARLHPYSQLIHLIHSRAAQDLRHPDKGELLNQSAVYSSDRSVLKWVMTTSRKERIAALVTPHITVDERIEAPVIVSPAMEKKINAPVIVQPVTKEKIDIPPAATFASIEATPRFETSEKVNQPLVVPSYENGLTGDALREDLYHELEKLKRLKHDFEVSWEEFQKSNYAKVDVDSRPKLKNSIEPENEPLLEEIKTTKKKLKVDNPKQKEQNEIIDQFIKTQPVIPKAKAAQPANDLSEDSGIFSNNIVSETLVDILLKQGKKDKAIEVLKKLIWKFPQKKAYFAAQIEELKN